MREPFRATLLGCGNSTGVPAVGDFWGACDPAEPKNNRTRSSLALETENTTVIIDTGPDFRIQMNREAIKRVDAVLYTHAHSDHVSGMDELRIIYFRNKTQVPVYASKETFDDLYGRVPYLFNGGSHDIYPAVLAPHEIAPFQYGKPLHIGDFEIVPFLQDHGTCESLGYRMGDLAYSLDFIDLPDSAIEVLKGVHTWVVDCAAYHQTNNVVHANLERIYALNQKIGAKMVYLSSLTLAMDYETLCRELPEGYAPAYDGLQLVFGYV